MKHFDPDHPDSNQLGSNIEPSATAHSGSLEIYPTCFSKPYIEWFYDSTAEIINCITGAGLTLDGTDRTQLRQAVSKLAGSTSDVKFSYVQTAPDGWVFNTGTIGSLASGASQRANIDTLALYTIIWDLAEAVAPIEGGTRGSDALTDFNADLFLTLPNGNGRALIAKDNMNLVESATSPASGVMDVFDATILGNAIGSDDHLLLETEMPSHDHDAGTLVSSNPNAESQTDGSGGITTLRPKGAGTEGIAVQGDTGQSGGDLVHNNTQPVLVLNSFIKL